jgi:WD40 repeat protein
VLLPGFRGEDAADDRRHWHELRDERLVTQIYALALTPDGRRALVGFDTAPDGMHGSLEGGVLALWDLEAGREVWAVRGLGGVDQIALLPGGGEALVVVRGRPLTVWDVERGKAARAFEESSRGQSHLSLSADGRLVLTGGWKAALYDVPSGQRLRILYGRYQSVGDVALSPDGKRALGGFHATLDADRMALWDAEANELLRRWPNESKLEPPFAFSPDGKRILSGLRRGSPDEDDRLILWDVESGAEVWRTQEWFDEVAFAADGKGVLVAKMRGPFGLLDAASGKAVWMSNAKEQGVRAFAFAADGRRVLSAEGHHLHGGGDGQTIRLKLWDGADGRLIRAMEIPK